MDISNLSEETVEKIDATTNTYMNYSKGLLQTLVTQKPDLKTFMDEMLPEYYENLNTLLAEFNALAPSPITCGAGCSVCCDTIVTATPIEAVYIWLHLFKTRTEEEIAAYRDEIVFRFDKKKELEQRVLDGDQLYKEYIHLKIPCQFVGDTGSCMIYEARPSSCRNFNVISDPKFCADLDNLNKVQAWSHPNFAKLNYEFQKICTVIFFESEDIGTMQEMMLKYESVARDLYEAENS